MYFKARCTNFSFCVCPAWRAESCLTESRPEETRLLRRKVRTDGGMCGDYKHITGCQTDRLNHYILERGVQCKKHQTGKLTVTYIFYTAVVFPLWLKWFGWYDTWTASGLRELLSLFSSQRLLRSWETSARPLIFSTTSTLRTETSRWRQCDLWQRLLRIYWWYKLCTLRSCSLKEILLLLCFLTSQRTCCTQTKTGTGSSSWLTLALPRRQHYTTLYKPPVIRRTMWVSDSTEFPSFHRSLANFHWT